MVATACPEYPLMPENAKVWVKESLSQKDNQSFREWLADIAVLKERLEICRES